MLLGAAGTKARALWLSTVLLAGVRGVHPPPDKCCDGPARPVLWISLSNTSALAAACTQLHYSKENSLGCAALTACTHDGEDLWMTCPDGFEADCVLGCTALPQASSCPEPQQSLVEWLSSNGGFISPRLRIDSGQLGRGLFATEDIEISEVLVSLPSEVIILDGRSPCLAIKRLRNELQKGPCSFYWPYLKSLHEIEISLPAVWSLEDLALLDGLPTPKGGWQSYTQRYFKDCLESDGDALALRALLLYHTRAGPLGMTPVADIMNHGYNMTWHGFDQEDVMKPHGRGTFWMRSSSAIKAGSEVLNSIVNGVAFRPTLAAGMHADDFDGAAEIFRNYGFMEDPPVMWWFDSAASGTHHAWIQMDAKGTPSWFADTDDHGPGTNLTGLVEDGSALLEDLQVREARLGMIYGPGSDEQPFSFDAKAHIGGRHRRMALAYRQAFKHALKAAIEAAKVELRASGAQAGKEEL